MIKLGKRQERPAPPDRPFEHAPDCRLKDARPEWVDFGRGVWKRSCRCRSETWRDPVVTYDPDTQSPEPDPARAHEVFCDPSCPAAAHPALVSVERYRDGGWLVRCLVSNGFLHFWWARPEDTWRRSDNGDLVRVLRSGPVVYRYPVKPGAWVPVE
jgi:hypothetical protein